MTDDNSKDVQRRTLLKATGVAAAGSVGLAGVASAQSDEFTVTSSEGGGQRTSGDVEVLDPGQTDISGNDVDVKRLKFESVDAGEDEAEVTVNGVVDTAQGKEPFKTTDTVDLVVESTSASVQSSGVDTGLLSNHRRGRGCPRGTEELITLTVDDLLLNLLGIVVAINDIDIAVCCDPDFLIGQLLCDLLRTNGA